MSKRSRTRSATTRRPESRNTYWRYAIMPASAQGPTAADSGCACPHGAENFLSGVAARSRIGEEEMLLPTEAADEALVMGLRLSEG